MPLEFGSVGKKTRARFTLGLAVVFGVALAIRLACILELRGTALFSVVIGDSLMFDRLARDIVSGNWLGNSQYYEPQLYAYLLALIYKVAGADWFVVRILQAFFGATSCVLIAIATRCWFRETAGLAAGALLAVYGPAIFFDVLIHKSSVDGLLTALLLLALAEAGVRGGRRVAWVVVAGASLAALSWNRENARLLIPVIAAWFAWQPREQVVRKRLVRVGAFLLGTALVLGPVIVRNMRASGEALLSSSQFGANFYIGNHKGATGGYEPLVPGRGNSLFEREDAGRVAEATAGRSLTPSEVSDFWLGRAVADIRAAPGAWMVLLAKKTWLTVAAEEPIDTESIGGYARYSRVLWLLRWVSFGVLLGLAGVGVWQTRARWRALSVLYVLFIVTAASVVMFFVFARYRYPLVPIALPFAGAGIDTLLRVRGLPRREWVPALTIGLVIALLLHVPVRTSSDETFLNYGNELVRQGRVEEALPFLRQAVQDDPNHFEARLDLAFALDQLPQFEKSDEIIEQYRQAIRLQPQSALAHGGLAMALHKRQRTEEAIVEYREALRLKPDFTEVTSNLALALLQAGRAAEGIDVFRKAVGLEPQNILLRLNLCRALAGATRQSEALACYRQAASQAREPQDVLRAEYEYWQALAGDRQVAAAIFSLERALSAARTLGDAASAATIEQALQIVRSARAP